MKKLTVFLIAMCFVGVLSAQTSNRSKYVYNFAGGITIGGTYATQDWNETIDSIRVIAGELYVFSGADTLAAYIPSVNQGSLYDYAARKYPDTLRVTTVEFRPQLTDANKIIYCANATQNKIFLPPDSTVNFPLTTVMTFIMDNTGIVTFYEGTNSGTDVVTQSKNDSTSINVREGAVSVIKRASNRWKLVGDLQD